MQLARRRDVSIAHALAEVAPSSLGIAFETTDTMPSPPSAITASVSSSSPESTVNSPGRPRMMSAICAELPRRLLHRRDSGVFASSSVVFASMLLPVRPGTL